MDNSLSGFVKENVGAQTPPAQTEEEHTNLAYISDAMDDEVALNELDTESKPEVVVLIGFPEYGKTSFVATCYQYLLNNGKIGEYEFYDSDTFIGFERRVFARRMTENNTSSGTKRTARGEAFLLTLRFSCPDKRDKVIVFSDKSGEIYAEYASKKNMVASDKLLPYADRILFFIDCKSLVNSEFMALKDDYETLLRNMKEANLPSDSTIINLVFNKKDLVKDNQQVFETKKSEIMTVFKDFLGDIPYEEFLVVSNNMNDSSDITSLLQEIVSHSTYNKPEVDNSNFDLDWVRKLIKK